MLTQKRSLSESFSCVSSSKSKHHKNQNAGILPIQTTSQRIIFAHKKEDTDSEQKIKDLLFDATMQSDLPQIINYTLKLITKFNRKIEQIFHHDDYEYYIEYSALCSAIGNHYLNDSDYDNAIKYYKQAASYLTSDTDVHSNIIWCYSVLGNLYCAKNQYDLAIEQYTKAIPICKDVGHNKLLMTIYHNLGNAYNAQSQYTKAIEAHEELLKMKHKIYGTYEYYVNTKIAESYSILSILYEKIKNYGQSVPYARSALEIFDNFDITEKNHVLYNNKKYLQHILDSHLTTTITYIEYIGDLITKEICDDIAGHNIDDIN